MDRMKMYGVLYSLAARDGRERALFGTCYPLSCEALARSLVADAFPELWFEVPLAGEPWFDLHALATRESILHQTSFSADTCGGCPEAFEWFATGDAKNGRQLALSYDVSAGDIDHPAVQLLLSRDSVDTTCGFLRAVGRSDAEDAYRSFHERLPRRWFACYTGVFPRRPQVGLRVECIPSRDLQRAYGDDVSLFEAHLRQVGLPNLSDGLLERCQLLARTPFQFEFQFDVGPDGTVGPTLGASVRFAPPSSSVGYQPFDEEGPAGDLMAQVEDWGLADVRWRLLAKTSFAVRLKRDGESAVLISYPAGLKLRWHAGQPLDAKAYLIAGVKQ